jgi:hypothetical protein
VRITIIRISVMSSIAKRTPRNLVVSSDKLDAAPDLSYNEHAQKDRIVLEGGKPAAHIGVATLAFANL